MTFYPDSTDELHSLAEFTLEHAEFAVIWVDAQARIRMVNLAASKRLGYTKDQLCALTIPDINPNFNHEDWPAHWQTLKRIKQQTFETIHRTQHGKLIPVEVSSNFIVYEGEEFDCSFSREISKRKHLELERDRFRNILDQAGEAIYIADPLTWQFLDCNDTACEMLGYSKSEILGLKINDITQIHHVQSREAWNSFIEQLEGQPAPHRFPHPECAPHSR